MKLNFDWLKKSKLRFLFILFLFFMMTLVFVWRLTGAVIFTAVYGVPFALSFEIFIYLKKNWQSFNQTKKLIVGTVIGGIWGFACIGLPELFHAKDTLINRLIFAPATIFGKMCKSFNFGYNPSPWQRFVCWDMGEWLFPTIFGILLGVLIVCIIGGIIWLKQLKTAY